MPKMLCRGGTNAPARPPEHQPESLVAVNRIVPSDRVSFSPTMENEQAPPPPASFPADTALDDAAPRRIFRSTVIFTRVVAPQWILLLPAIVNDFEALAASRFSSPSQALHPSPFATHCSKSLHRDILSSVFFIRIYQFVSTPSATATLLSIIIQTRGLSGNRSSSRLAPLATQSRYPPLQTAKAFSRIITTLCSSPCTQHRVDENRCANIPGNF